MEKNTLTPADYEDIFAELEEHGHTTDLEDLPSIDDDLAFYEAVDIDALNEEPSDYFWEEPPTETLANPELTAYPISLLGPSIWMMPEPEDDFILASRKQDPETDSLEELKKKYGKIDSKRAKWLLALILAHLELREKIRRWLERKKPRQDEAFKRLLKGRISTTDYPLGPEGVPFGPETKDIWKSAHKGKPYHAKLDLGDEVEAILKSALGKFFAALTARLGMPKIGQDVGEKFGKNLAKSLDIQGWVKTESLWSIRYYYDVQREAQARKIFEAKYRTALTLSYQIARATPVPQFGKAGDVKRVLTQELTPIVNLVRAAFSSPKDVAKLLFEALRNPQSFRLPDIERSQDAARNALSLFEPWRDEGFRCTDKNPKKVPKRKVFENRCMRLIKFGPLNGPGAEEIIRRNDFLFGAFEFYPIEPINYRLFPHDSPVFLRNIDLEYKAHYYTSFPTDWERVVKEAAANTVKDIFDDLLNWAKSLPKKKFKAWLGKAFGF